MDQRRELKREALARDGGCVGARLVRFVPCMGQYDLDEIRPRARGGSPLDLENVQILCRAHHEWKHANPITARERGLTTHSWEG